MIATKEEYELIARDVQGGRAWQDLNETIEALRRFVRAHEAVDRARIGAVSALSMEEFNGLVEEFRDARDALPDWITEE